MRIAVVGATHPFKGGVAAHTTQTAHRLAADGHQVDLVSWSRLYPARLYPGQQVVPDGAADLPPFTPTRYPLRWDRPGTWWRTGAGLRDHDLVLLAVVTPVQVPALRVLAGAARRRRGGPRIVVIAHNVAPHETFPGGARLMATVLRSVDGVVVHAAEQERLARGLGAGRVLCSELPAHLPGGIPTPQQRAATGQTRCRPRPPVRLLAFGLVRHYKGVDLLLEAMREVPEVTLTVAGEQWGQAGDRVRQLAAEPGLRDRVVLRPGYLPASATAALLADHDVLTLTYRTATASQNVTLAHAHGMPVLASTVGTFGEQVRDGVDGLLVPPDDVPALREALRRLVRGGTLDTLFQGVPVPDLDLPWRRYLDALFAAGGIA